MTDALGPKQTKHAEDVAVATLYHGIAHQFVGLEAYAKRSLKNWSARIAPRHAPLVHSFAITIPWW
jgi:hypothetical protein